MTTIRDTCPACGEVSLTPGQIDLRADFQDGRWIEVASYSFRCPDCDDVIRKPADDRIVQLLTSGGVAVLPNVSPSRHAGGAPFTWDDLIEFHRELARPGWFARLQEVTE